MAEIDDGSAIHYSAVEPGTPVYAEDGSRVGKVVQMVDNYEEHILDGYVIEDEGGEIRWVDGPEVGRTAERGVTLTIAAADVENLGPPEDGPGSFKLRRGGRISRLLGGDWKRG